MPDLSPFISRAVSRIADTPRDIFNATVNFGRRLFPGGPLESAYGIDQTNLTPSMTAEPIPEPPQAANPKQTFTTASLGGAGTPIFSGFVQDLGEYKPDLYGRTGILTWEQMRRGDADVKAALLACKLPIRSAEVNIVPGFDDNEPGYQYAKEIADFVEDNLFGGLEFDTRTGGKASQPFERVVENALLMLDFGCAGHEDLWTIDQDHIRLRRCAPRLPITFYRFWPDADGETLLAIEQYGYRANNFINARIPAEKFSLFVNEQEGANFYGRSILRSAYIHWYSKAALYRIDNIALERNGMGIPTITLPPGFSVEDRNNAQNWVNNVAVSEGIGLVMPSPEWKFELAGLKGRPRDPANSIRHHSEMIVRSVLAMFLALGTTQTGSRALGSVLADFFYLSLDAIARRISEVLNQTTIRRLVDYNYSPIKGMHSTPYPKLQFSNIVVLNTLEMLFGMKDIAKFDTDLLEPDDELEAWLRRKLGMPPKGTPRIRYQPIGQRITERENLPEQPGGPLAGAPPIITPETGDIGTAVKTPQGRLIPQKTQSPRTIETPQPFSEQPYKAWLSDVRGAQAGETVAVDFDGVLAAKQTPFVKGEMGEPLQKGFALVRALKRAGYRVVILTARQETPQVKTWLAKQGLRVDDVTNVKPPAIAYIDDRAVEWDDETNLKNVMHMIKERQHEEKLAEKRPFTKTPSRELKPHERKVDFDGHAERAKKTAGLIARALRKDKPRVMREAAHQAANHPLAHLDAVTIPYDRSIAARIEKILKPAQQYGYDQVYAERWRAIRKGRKEPATLSDGRTTFQGIPIRIENPKGSVRSGEDNGHHWSVQMTHDYGYVQRMNGLDQEKLDCFIGPDRSADNVYVVTTKEPGTGKPDEEKCFVGFGSASEARQAFMDNYDSPKHFHSLRTMSLDEFKQWLGASGTKVSLADRKPANQRVPDAPLIADATLSNYINWISSRAKGEAVDAYQSGVDPSDREDEILDGLLAGSDGLIDKFALEAALGAINAGRWEGFREFQGDIDEYMRTELMDDRTCQNCEEGDGTTWTSLDDVDWQVGDDCDGGNNCRGQLIAIMSGEGKTTLE
jgi:Inorganic Pyrophosphatase